MRQRQRQIAERVEFNRDFTAFGADQSRLEETVENVDNYRVVTLTIVMPRFTRYDLRQKQQCGHDNEKIELQFVQINNNGIVLEEGGGLNNRKENLQKTLRSVWS